MLACPGCHIGLAPLVPPMAPCTPSPHWVAATHVTPGAVQPPYVCGRMFQVGALGGVRPCLPMPHDACHVLCCLACPHAYPHACPTLRPCQSKLLCAAAEARSSLHTSGGGLVDGEAETGRSITPDSKASSQVSCLNPFLLPAATPAATRQPAAPHPAAPHPTAAHPPPPATQPDSVCDSRVLTATKLALEESGWYYGAISWQQAAAMLQDTSVGTFLLRDSASPQCLYSLSVQTTNGPTSVRIHYSCGKFRLDCTSHNQKKNMPEFDGVVPLVQHYVSVTSSQVWVDHEGNTFSPIDIRRPFRRTVPSLQHFCRLALNTTSASVTDVPLPPALRSFLKSYPHTC
ncbi:cytokine-inducible SH2-containing protein-like [Homarus americanus]|nr:cytokine-inducible SH2-containing protein-like [Homarus americanus]